MAFKRFGLAAVAALALSGTCLGSAAAQSTIADFSPQNLKTALAGSGATVEEVPGTDGLAVRLPDGRVVILDPNCVSGGNCPGLSILAFINAPADLGALASFNSRHLSVRASMTSANKVVLNRYLIGDYGYDPRNLQVDLSVVFSAILRYQDWTRGASAVSVSYDVQTESEARHVMPMATDRTSALFDPAYANNIGQSR